MATCCVAVCGRSSSPLSAHDKTAREVQEEGLNLRDKSPIEGGSDVIFQCSNVFSAQGMSENIMVSLKSVALSTVYRRILY